jgi:hypothetical protein
MVNLIRGRPELPELRGARVSSLVEVVVDGCAAANSDVDRARRSES